MILSRVKPALSTGEGGTDAGGAAAAAKAQAGQVSGRIGRRVVYCLMLASVSSARPSSFPSWKSF